MMPGVDFKTICYGILWVMCAMHVLATVAAHLAWLMT